MGRKKWSSKENQAGFRRKRSTVDHIFTLNSLIQNKLKRADGRIYVASVDFKAAFVSMNRKLVLKKLEANMIQTIYRLKNWSYNR